MVEALPVAVVEVGVGVGVQAGPWSAALRAGERRTYPCSGKHCGGTVNIRNRRNPALLFGVCDTCGVYFNFKKFWGTGDNPRGCDWCGDDTADSPD